MEWYWSLALLVGAIAALIMLGFPVAIAFIIANIIGTLIFAGGFAGLIQIVENSTDLVTSFTLVPVPLFVLMGALFFHTGLAKRVFDALDLLLGRLPGRLSFLAIGGGTVFAALTGSSLANAAMLGSLLIPEMEKRRYKRHMAIGPIMAVGGLAIIIPPSAISVLLAGIANVDVGRVLIAGIVPGLLLAVFFCMVVAIQLWLDPEAAPAYDTQPIPFADKMRLLLVDTVPIFVIIAAVVGSIIFGIATPTESAAFGVVAVLLSALLFRTLTPDAVKASLRDTVMVGGVVFFIVMGSAVFSQLLAYSGSSRGLLQWATSFDVPPVIILLSMVLILLVLGTFMDQVSMILITVPIFFPLASALGFDLVWFSMVVLLAIEVGLVTPPFGLLLFIMVGQAPPGTSFGDVVRAGIPFLIVHAVVILLIIAFPDLVLFLPRMI